jgi:hypothetical protein
MLLEARYMLRSHKYWALREKFGFLGGFVHPCFRRNFVMPRLYSGIFYAYIFIPLLIFNND